MDILELKNAKCEINNSVNRFNSRLHVSIARIRELEDRSVKKYPHENRTEHQAGKLVRMGNVLDAPKRAGDCVPGAPGGEGRKCGRSDAQRGLGCEFSKT